MAKTDGQISQEVLAELAEDRAVTVADLTVSPEQGRVRLSGTAETSGTKLEAGDATYRVGGVRSVENEITLHPAALGPGSDAAMAADTQREEPFHV